ncbi:MAG: hypothetical protein ABIQ10_05015 [Gemmatimonadaceae bacterium]
MSTIGVALVALSWSARKAEAQGIPDSVAGRTIVTYVTGQSVYIGAGRLDGVWLGSRVMIVRGGGPVAELRVRYLSSHGASCEASASASSILPGDSVRFSVEPATSPSHDSSVTTVAAARPRSARAMSWSRSAGIRGRVGVSYLLVSPRDSTQGRISQPAADLRVEGYNVGGSSLSFVVDARTRRTYLDPAAGASSSDGGTRVYQASLSWTDVHSGARVTLGRQYSNPLSPVSLYDGATAELDKQRWAVGLFGGTQPDYQSLSFSGAIREYGGYLQLHQAKRTPDQFGLFKRWSITLGGIDSYDYSSLNREFMFAQVQYADRRLFLFATQEVDYNRGWKRDLGEAVLAPTSTFATAQLQLTDAVSVHTGFDNRRNVRLYRDFISPETSFDDSFREGYWGGVNLTAFRHLRLGVDARASSGGSSGRANSYTGTAGLERVFPFEGGLRFRATQYTSDRVNGWLYSGAVGVTPAWRLHLELNGGTREDRYPPGILTSDSPAASVRWIGVDADVGLARSWYLLLSGSRTSGGGEGNDQLYFTLSYRF